VAFTNQYNTSVSSSQANTTVSFGFDPSYLLLINDGSSEVYVNFTGAAATSSSFEIKSGESLAMTSEAESDGFIGSRIDVICATGETATVRVLALR
jgi:hypothetical protein